MKQKSPFPRLKLQSATALRGVFGRPPLINLHLANEPVCAVCNAD